MAVGLVLIVTAVIMEANQYPWGVLFRQANQNEQNVPDPSPIELNAEDGWAVITEAPTPSAASSADVSADLTDPSTSPSENVVLPGDEEETQTAPDVPVYVVSGVLKIPVLGVSQNILEGTGKQMGYGVGHVEWTAAPGQEGNCSLAGHRPYPFRYLDMLTNGDVIVIKSGGVTYTYSVFDLFDVLPSETWVLNPVEGEQYTLTLITCTPYLVSSHRLIVRARLIDIDGMTPEAYYAPDTSAPSDIPETVAPSPSDIPSAAPTSDTQADESAEPAVTTAEPSPAGSESADPTVSLSASPAPSP